jgi:hypothetical protein
MTFVKRQFANTKELTNGNATIYVPDMSKAWIDTGVTAPFCRSNVIRVGTNYYTAGYNGSASTGNIWSAPVDDCTNWSVAGTLPDSKVISFCRLAVVGEYVYIFGALISSTAENRRIFRAPIGSPTTFTDTGQVVPIKSYESSLLIFDRIYGMPCNGNTNWDYAELADPTVWSSFSKSVVGWERSGLRTEYSVIQLCGYSGADINQYMSSVQTATALTFNCTTGSALTQYPIAYEAGDKVYFFGDGTKKVAVFSLSGDGTINNDIGPYGCDNFPFNEGYVQGSHWISNGYYYTIQPGNRRIWRSARKTLTCSNIPSGLEPFQAYNEYGLKEWVSRHVRLGYAPWFTNRFDI